MENNKNIKIGILVLKTRPADIIVLILLIILIILYFLAPKVYLVTTARYGKGSEVDNNNVKIALGTENTEERFLLYFQWYNVIHELGHGVLRNNSDIKIDAVEEEQLVNDFAIAYWLYYGEEDKINELENIVEYASTHIKSDADANITYMEFGKENWGKSSFNTFNNYGWFQFSSVKEALNRRKTLDQVLKEMGVENIHLPEPELLQYPEINEETSTQIINDAVNNFYKCGIKFPRVIHFYSNNPNTNHSRNGNNFLGIYDLINKFSK